jgi:hypothetical protein
MGDMTAMLQIASSSVGPGTGGADTTLFTVSRAISAWKKAAIFDGGRGRIEVRDLKQLTAISRANRLNKDEW